MHAQVQVMQKLQDLLYSSNLAKPQRNVQLSRQVIMLA